MAANPFNKVVPHAEIRLDDNPDLAVIVAKVFAISSVIERELSFLLVRVLGADAEPAIAMFDALTAQHQQFKALDAAAKAHLQPNVLGSDAGSSTAWTRSPDRGRRATARPYLRIAFIRASATKYVV
jgi:hypothetical protein